MDEGGQQWARYAAPASDSDSKVEQRKKPEGKQREASTVTVASGTQERRPGRSYRERNFVGRYPDGSEVRTDVHIQGATLNYTWVREPPGMYIL